VLDIPDLRVRSDPYIDLAEDRAKGVALAAQCEGAGFAETVDHYYRNTPVVTAAQARQFTRGLLAAAARAAESLTTWERSPEPGASLIDIGCGTAPRLVTAAGRYQRVLGVDIAFRWLVVAKKRLADAGVDVPLVCACAEALPFPDGTFDRIVLDSVIEHTWSQEETLAESYRVTRPGGRLFFATPNRFSPGPDPHTGLWGGSLLPASITERYVRRQGGIPPERKLLSAGRLRDAVARSGFVETRLYLPDISRGQRAAVPVALRWLVSVFQFGKRLPFARRFFLLIGPILHGVARKPGPIGVSEGGPGR
jgi:SAM-dependent methyltransferase